MRGGADSPPPPPPGMNRVKTVLSGVFPTPAQNITPKIYTPNFFTPKFFVVNVIQIIIVVLASFLSSQKYLNILS